MAIAWTDVQVVAPELTNTAVPTGTQAVLLTMVDRQIDDTEWGDLANDGRTYLAAHLGSLYASDGAAAGSISSETLGPMSRSYSLPSGVDGELSTTKYGVWYKHLLALLPGSLGFVP